MNTNSKQHVYWRSSKRNGSSRPLIELCSSWTSTHLHMAQPPPRQPAGLHTAWLHPPHVFFFVGFITVSQLHSMRNQWTQTFLSSRTTCLIMLLITCIDCNVRRSSSILANVTSMLLLYPELTHPLWSTRGLTNLLQHMQTLKNVAYWEGLACHIYLRL